MTGIAYSNLTTQLTDLLEYPLVSASSATPSSDPNFNNILPAIINDAEQRIYREADFLNDRLQDSTLTVTMNGRNFTIPSEVIVVQSMALVLPSGSSTSTGTRISLLRTSVDALNAAWPQEGYTVAPTQGLAYYAMLSNTQALIAPTPPASYVCEVTGVYRPPAMSSSNTTTYLGTNFPDLFLSACMVFGSAFQRDFVGGASEDPAMAVNWESHYQVELKSVLSEEARRRGLKPEPA